MNEPHSASIRTHRLTQFSIRSLLVMTLLLAGLLAAWRIYSRPYTMQQTAIAVIQEHGGSVITRPGGTQWLRERFGAEKYQDIIHVDLGDADIDDRCVGYLGNLPRVESIVVGGAEFGDKRLRRFRKLHSLKWLVLDSTGVTDAEVEQMKNRLPKTSIRLSQRRAIAKAGTVASVETVDQHRYGAPTGIIGDEHFQETVGIVILNKDVTESEVQLLRPLGAVKSIWFGQKLTDDAVEYLVSLADLDVLELPSTNIDDAGLARLSELDNLELLNLAKTRITDEGLAHLTKLPKLTCLYLYGTEISDAGLVHLRGLSQLSRLYLDDTQVSEEGLRELRRALPDTMISPVTPLCS